MLKFLPWQLVRFLVVNLKPTPVDGELQLPGRIAEIKGRKVVVETEVFAGGVVTARGKVVAVQMPDDFATRPR